MHKPNLYVFDFDGTLADLGTRSPYAYADSAEDDPIPETIALFKTLAMHQRVLILTGRKEKWRYGTLEWLRKFVGIGFPLLMQESDPAEKNHVFKEAKLAELQKEYNILGVFDDNPDMVSVCDRLGLKLYLCN